LLLHDSTHMPPVCLCSQVAPRPTLPAVLVMPHQLQGSDAFSGAHNTSYAAVYCRKYCPLTQWCLQEE